MSAALPWGPPWDEARNRWAEWLRSLDGASGVYLIRDAPTGQLLYVGESSFGRLYGTITRHFQGWSRTWWAEQHGLPGTTYHREHVEVSVILAESGRARSLQYALIQELRPLDNQVSGDSVVGPVDEDEGVPF